MKWKQTDPLYRGDLDTAWKKELFYSNMYPLNQTVEWVDTDIPENAIYDKEITYTFNEYGFRSDSFNDRADINILTCGCSNTVGVGVTHEESWPFALKHKIQEMGKSAMVYNIATSGASSQYVVRSIYKVINILNPTHIFIYWPPITRLEIPYHPGERFSQEFLDQSQYPKIYADETWLLKYNLIRDYSFLMEISNNANVPIYTSLEDKAHQVHSMIGKVGDRELFETFIEAKTDARDGIHPGADWHEKIAESFIKHINT